MGKAVTVTRKEFLKLYKDENIDIVLNNCMDNLSPHCKRHCSVLQLRVAVLDYISAKLYPMEKFEEELDEYHAQGTLPFNIPKRKKFDLNKKDESY